MLRSEGRERLRQGVCAPRQADHSCPVGGYSVGQSSTEAVSGAGHEGSLARQVEQVSSVFHGLSPPVRWPAICSTLSSIQNHFPISGQRARSEEHTSELQSRENLVCRLLLEKKKIYKSIT